MNIADKATSANLVRDSYPLLAGHASNQPGRVGGYGFPRLMILRRRSRWLLLPVRTRPSPGQTPVGECKKHKDVAERVGDISPPLQAPPRWGHTSPLTRTDYPGSLPFSKLELLPVNPRPRSVVPLCTHSWFYCILLPTSPQSCFPTYPQSLSSLPCPHPLPPLSLRAEVP